MYATLAVLGAFVLIYSLLAKRIEHWTISGPILFVLVGLLLGPNALDVLSVHADAELLSVLAELTLALVLFTDASGVDLTVLKRTRTLPIHLLGIGLPLTILLGFLAGVIVFPGMPVMSVALLATMLAPTDAALGKAVVTNEAVPSSVRQGLNVESGLNDGICVPVLFLFLTLAQGLEEGHSALGTGLLLFAKAVGIGIVCGVVVSLLAVFLLRLSLRHDWFSESWTKVSVLAAAFCCFGLSQALDGSGFIASFVGGLIFGHLSKPHHERLLEAAEGIGDTFALLTWVVFGAIAVSPIFNAFSWQALLYAVLSLTIIRMLPVWLSLSKLQAPTEAKLFIGWFGPRGLASIVFAVIVLDAELPGAELLTMIVVYTVLLSIILHGISAEPWANAFGRRMGRARQAQA